MTEETTPVLIVGGSLVGLSAAMFLAARGVAPVLVERHAGSAIHPRAVGYTARTLELFDAAGLTGIPEVPPSYRLRRVRAESLAGTWHEETDWTPKAEGAPPQEAADGAFSPHTGAAIAQDKLEPLLRERARALGADLRLGTELVRFTQDADGVTAWLKGSVGPERRIRARYVIAADGHRSAVREALGIGRTGLGLIQVLRSVLFRADLERFQRGVGQFEIQQPGLDAFLTTYGDGRWVLMFKDDRDRDEAELRRGVAMAIGAPVPFESLTTGRWELSARIADRFVEGRVFLAGDAAHTLPPTRGGYGANTGIADAYNLAWKLAAVLAGESAPELLASYDEERRPIAWLRLRQTFARPDYARWADDATRATPILDPVAVELGELYRSRIVPVAGLPDAQRPDAWRGQPGTRAPHVAVILGGRSASTLDLVGRGWVLVSADARWREAARAMAARIGVVVEAPDLDDVLGAEDRASYLRALGLDEAGASLVRPDGVVAWRATDEAPGDEVLARVMAIAACAARA